LYQCARQVIDGLQSEVADDAVKAPRREWKPFLIQYHGRGNWRQSGSCYIACGYMRAGGTQSRHDQTFPASKREDTRQLPAGISATLQQLFRSDTVEKIMRSQAGHGAFAAKTPQAAVKYKWAVRLHSTSSYKPSQISAQLLKPMEIA